MLKHLDRTDKAWLWVLAIAIVAAFMWGLSQIDAAELKPINLPSLQEQKVCTMECGAALLSPNGFTRAACARAGRGSCALQGVMAIQVVYSEIRRNGLIETTCYVPCSGGKPAFDVTIIEGDPDPPAPDPKPCNCDDGPCPDGCPS